MLCVPPCVSGGEAHGRSARPSCDAEFARALKLFYHSMTSARAELQRLRRHRPSVSTSVGLQRSLEGLMAEDRPGFKRSAGRLSPIKPKLEDFHFYISLECTSEQ